MNPPFAFPLRRVVSGGQTGVDRAALDAAMAQGLPVGGWCPRGRRAEDGPLDARYPLAETPLEDYAQRTAWNVRDSDGTLILRFGASSPGTDLTVEEARRQGKPVLVVDLPASPEGHDVTGWIEANGVRVLNVAGPREGEAPGGYAAARAYLARFFEALRPFQEDER